MNINFLKSGKNIDASNPELHLKNRDVFIKNGVIEAIRWFT